MSEHNEYEIRLVRSAAPCYITGAYWLLCALLFPMYRWYHYLIVLLTSIAVYWLAGRLFPPKKEKIARPRQIETSGNSEVDRQISAAGECVKAIEHAGVVIAPLNNALAIDIAALIDDAYKILSYLAKNPDKASLLRRFLNYYLPTLRKLLDSYPEFKANEKTEDTAASIEKAVHEMRDVFRKQRDKIVEDRELDISTDIAALESMLSGDRLHSFTAEAAPETTNEKNH